MFEIKRYSSAFETEWNDFVARSKNGTFLIDRRYMDYHADRFDDHSLLFYRDGELYALLPANITVDSDGQKTLHSHQGLTYGGLITTTETTASAVITLFEELNEYLRIHGIAHVIYKAIPWIYHTHPAEEDLYALFRVCNARLIARDISSTIPLNAPLRWARDRRYGINKARNNGVIVCAVDANLVPRTPDWRKYYAAFWQVLENNLGNKYGVHPVHTIEEMILLKERFIANIKLYIAMKDGEVLAGTVLYITPRTVHAQYISASPEGKRLRAIDAIYDVILNHDFAQASQPSQSSQSSQNSKLSQWSPIPHQPTFFDFGKSTEDHGHILNTSLIYQKEGFGSRGVCYDTYEWDVM